MRFGSFSADVQPATLPELAGAICFLIVFETIAKNAAAGVLKVC